MNKRKYTIAFLIIVCVGLAIWNLYPKHSTNETNSHRPSPELQRVVNKIDVRGFSAIERIRLACFYRSMADVIDADCGKYLSDDKSIHTLNTTAGQRCFGNDLMDGGHSRVADVIDQMLRDAAKNETLVDTCRAIAWRFNP